MFRITRFSLIALIGLSFSVAAQADFLDGWHAYKRGDFKEALQHWKELSENGDSVVQYNVGVMYDGGTGIVQDSAKVINWWRKAAAQDHVLAQHNLALLSIERGGEEDLRQAAHWLKRAVTKGFALSQYSLAKLYATGLGIKKDEVRGLALYLEAGFVKAQYNLGKLYRDGIGTDADPIAAAGWFMRAAVQGYAKAQGIPIRSSLVSDRGHLDPQIHDRPAWRNSRIQANQAVEMVSVKQSYSPHDRSRVTGPPNSPSNQ
jgi:TPR repeat protein